MLIRKLQALDGLSDLTVRATLCNIAGIAPGDIVNSFVYLVFVIFDLSESLSLRSLETFSPVHVRPIELCQICNNVY